MTDLNILDGGTLTKDSVFVQFRYDEYDYHMNDYWIIIDRTNPNYQWESGSIGSHMFVGMNLKKVVLPKSVTKIGYRAFYNCAYLEEIEFPENISMLNGDAFAYCQELRQVYIPSSVQWFIHPFYRCYNLENIGFGAGACVEQFSPQDGFWGTRLVSVVLPDIKTYYYTTTPMFNDCKLLESFTIPSSVQSASISFSDVPALKDIYLYAEPSSSITLSTSESKAGISLHVPSGRKTEYSRYYSGFTIVDDL